MSNSFDLCPQCVDKPAEREEFTHSVDHTLIKTRQYIHTYLFAWLINEARAMTTRLKKTFAELPLMKGQDKDPGEEHTISMRGTSGMLCSCCEKPVRVPCWICIICGKCHFWALIGLSDVT